MTPATPATPALGATAAAAELSVELAAGRAAFAPGEKLDGVARWNFAGAGAGSGDVPTSIEVRLFWFTRGKGTQDVELVDQLTIPSPALAGQRPFSFALPAGPYSFSGRLISLTWAIELVAPRNKRIEPARVEFVLSPFGREIDLTIAREPTP
jgi:hypothetical protein